MPTVEFDERDHGDECPCLDPKAPAQRVGPAIRKFIRMAQAAGWRLYGVNDGGGDDTIPVLTSRKACEVIFSVDSSHLFFKHADGRPGWVFVVLDYDMSPDEVFNDTTETLEAVWLEWLKEVSV